MTVKNAFNRILAAAAALAIFASVPAGAGDWGYSLNTSRAMSPYLFGKALKSAPSPRSRYAMSPVFGKRCVTEIGWCSIQPQPVGSPCKCGEVDGTTLQ